MPVLFCQISSMKKKVVAHQTRNNFSGLFLSKNLKIKQSQNQIRKRIWFCIEPPEHALCPQAEKKAENADIWRSTQPHSSRYSATQQPPICQLARSILPNSSHHQATQQPPQWMSESVLPIPIQSWFWQKYQWSPCCKALVNAYQRIWMNVEFFGSYARRENKI